MNYKKILSMLLTLSMLLSSFPISVLAVEESVQVPENNVQAEEPAIEQKTELQESTEALKIPEEVLPKLKESTSTETTVNPEEGSVKPETATQTAVSPISDFSYTKTWDSSYQECIKITGYNGTGGEVVIPAEIDGLPVKIIGSGAFAGNATITSVTLPENIYKLEESAFSNCDNMTNLVVPSTLKEVYVGALGFGGLMGNNLDFLKPATGLEYLDISGRRYGDYSALGSFKSLKTFKLNRSGLTSNELQFVKDMISLTTLELSGNQITDLNFVAGLTNLNKLYLVNNQITDLTSLTTLTKLNELNIANNQVKSLKGLENCKELNKLYASGNQITDFKALENMTYMFELDFSNNELTGLTGLVEGLKNISGSNLNLSNNQNLSDLTPLKSSSKKLSQIDVQNTQVTEEKAWEIVSVPAQIEESYLGINGGKLGYISLSPQVVYGNNQYTSSGNTYRSDNETVVSFETPENGSFKINGLGTANIIISRNGLEKRVPVVVYGPENPGEVGTALDGLSSVNFKVNRLPQRNFEEIGLTENGVLWNYSGQKPEQIMTNVKDVTVNSRDYDTDGTSRLFILDQNDSLWIQDRESEVKKDPIKVIDNVQHYVGNNAYNYKIAYEAWAWVLTKDGKVQRVNHDQTVTTDAISNVKEIKDFKLDEGFLSLGVLALTNDNRLLYRLDGETDYVELGQNITQFDYNGFTDSAGNYHKIQATNDFTTNKYTVTEQILGKGIVRTFQTRQGTDFYVKSDGSSWYKKWGQNEYQKFSDQPIAYEPISSSNTYVYLTEDKGLWCRDGQTGENIKIDSGVVKLNLEQSSNYDSSTGSYVYTFKGQYLKENGDLVDYGTGAVEKNVKDMVSGTPHPYIFYQDGRVICNGFEVLNQVVAIQNAAYVKPSTNNINGYYSELVMIRTDGSIYKINPTQRWKLEKVGQCEIESLLIGDVDHDGQIVAADALMALRHSVREITLSGNAYTCADVTFDQKVNSADALKILRYSVKEITEFEKPPVK